VTAPALRASRAACVASIVGVQAHEVPLSDDELRAWLGERALGLVEIADAAQFAWPGPWIARRGGEAVLMFGVPSGVIYDPAGTGGEPIDGGWMLAAHDVSLWDERDRGAEPGEGVVEAVLVAAAAQAPVQSVGEATAVPGLGLEGDRYATAPGGTFGFSRPGGALTLVEVEVLAELGFEGADARRNVVTRGIRLNALVGRRFMVGEVECAGRRLCEPCAHLERLAGRELLRPLVHRGGLRADILTAGAIRPGDPIRPLP
jgi:hypothetical protein